MADLPRAVQALLDELVESGEEVGLQAAVYVEGQPAADCMAPKILCSPPSAAPRG